MGTEEQTSDEQEMERALAAALEEDSRARRAEPLTFFGEVIDALLRNNDVETFLKIWRSRAVDYRAYAADALWCFERVASSPPVDLGERLFEHGGFKLFHMGPTEVAPYAPAEVIAWVRDLTSRMRALFEETAPGEGGPG